MYVSCVHGIAGKHLHSNGKENEPTLNEWKMIAHGVCVFRVKIVCALGRCNWPRKTHAQYPLTPDIAFI